MMSQGSDTVHDGQMWMIKIRLNGVNGFLAGATQKIHFYSLYISFLRS